MATAATKQAVAMVASLRRSRHAGTVSVASRTGTIANTPEYLTAAAAPAMPPAAANSAGRGSVRQRRARTSVTTAPRTITGSHRQSVVVSTDNGTIATIRPAIRPAPLPASRRPANAVKPTVAAATNRFAIRDAPTYISTGSSGAGATPP